LQKGRHAVTDCEVEISAERVDSEPKVFSRIHVHFIVSGKGLKESVVGRAIDLSSEKYCSASIMLAKSVEITHDFEILEID
jgi:putative redox protein